MTAKASDYRHEPRYPQPSPSEVMHMVRSAVAALQPTPSDILGPFYRPGAPWQFQLVNDKEVNLHLTGHVLDTNGKPVRGYIEFWQADKDGKYDEHGNGFRGIQTIAEDDGSYLLLTTVPGFYDISDPDDPEPHKFRCPHIHAKVWVGGRDILTTQLYFAEARYNEEDHWFDKRRVVKQVPPTGHHPIAGKYAIFDFIVAVAR